MATNIEHIAERPLAVTPDTGSAPGIWTRAITHIQSAVCGWHGHDPLLVFEDDRMFLRCTSCGHETPGWDTGNRRPRRRFTGDARRHQMEPRRARPVS